MALSGSTRVSRYQKKHSSTHTPPAHQPSLSASSIYGNMNHSIIPLNPYTWQSLSAQPLIMSSLAYLWVWSPLLHTPYTSSPNHHHPSATHVHTTAARFAAVTTPCPQLLVSQSTPHLKLYPSNFTPHIYPTTPIPAPRSAISFSFPTGQVSLPCNILLRTQLLHSLPLPINDTSLLVSKGTNCLNLLHPTF